MPPLDTPENVAASFCATLVDEWIHHGVRHAVIAPGSRSTPLALALTSRSELDVHVFHDERAAAFAALGIGLCGIPAILLCTSGTAAAHFHAAVIEAHQAGVPLIACTADRPPELRDVGAPQTIDQTKLFGDAVRWYHDPGVADCAARESWRALASHSFGIAVGSWPGPVHLNLPFREPLVGVPDDLPPRRGAGPVTLRSAPTIDDIDLRQLSAALDRRGVIVAGRGCGDPDAVRLLAMARGWPVLADARSGVRHHHDVTVCAADHLLRSGDFATSCSPLAILQIGEPPASKVVAQWLAGSRAVRVHVGATPAWSDAEGAAHHRVVAEPGDLCRRLAALSEGVDDHWLAGWIGAERLAQEALSAALDISELTEAGVARHIGPMLPSNSHLVVSSSMPIRDLEWFGVIPRGLTIHANRGANGIDGVLATAIGVALSSGAPTGVLLGDVALLHDSSALVALARRDVDLRIVVIDNDGGGIFSFLPQARSLEADRFEQLFGTPHGTDLVALASAHGLPARTVATLAELAAALGQPGPHLVRVATDRAANVVAHERLNSLSQYRGSM